MSKKYFVRANTSAGLVNIFSANTLGMKIYTVGGKSQTAKSKFLKAIGRYFETNGTKTEYVISPFDITQCEAVIAPNLNIAVADGAISSGLITADTDNCLSLKNLEQSDEYISSLEDKAKQFIGEMHRAYGAAKEIHDDWEKLYIANMDFDRLNAYGNGIIGQLLSSKGEKSTPSVRERFFGTSTPDGSVNYIDNLTEGLEKRYFIKGRPGTGKSTFLKRLAKQAQKSGYDTEIYYCGFDKNSLDMVIVPELSFCVFDSTAPHEMFPQSERDSVLDFYTEGGLTGIDEKFASDLSFIRRRYAFRISEGTAYMRLAHCLLAEREYYFDRVMNTDELAKSADKLIRKILN